MTNFLGPPLSDQQEVNVQGLIETKIKLCTQKEAL